MSNFVIVLPTHSSYIGITENFLQLLRKNWPDCPFKIIVSITGEKSKVASVDNLYNGKHASLIDCIVNVVKKYKAKYYISFLGDAFINDPLNNEDISLMLDSLVINNIEYCSLQCVKNYKKSKKFNTWFRHINNLDRYSHNFTAFVASRDFIMNELSRYKTDLDFEKAYLFQSKNFYYDNHLIVDRNYFHLLPSITKGKWDWINYRKLKRCNPEIEFEKREVQSYKESLICHIRGVIVSYLPSSIRRRIKSSAERAFNMNFGMEG